MYAEAGLWACKAIRRVSVHTSKAFFTPTPVNRVWLRRSSTMTAMKFPFARGENSSAPRPHAAKIEKVLEQFNEKRNDPWYWLRSDTRDDAKVLEHLKKENEYTEEVFEKPTTELRKQLFEEMRARIKEDDTEPAVRKDDWFYYSRTKTGSEYEIHCRRKVPNPGAPHGIHDDIDDSLEEEILLDENSRAGNRQYYHIGGMAVSPNHSILVWAEDTNGSEKYVLKFRDLTAGKDLEDEVENVSGNVAWCDNKTLFYLTKDDLDRPYKLWRYMVGSGEAPECLYTEEDEAFYVSISRSESEAYMFMHIGSAITSEAWYLATDNPTGCFTCVMPRKHGVEYDVTDHGKDTFVMVTNEDALNSKLLVTSPTDLPATKELIPHRPDVKVEGVDMFKDHMLVSVRQGGLRQLIVYDAIGSGQGFAVKNERSIKFEEEAYALRGAGGEFKSEVARFAYSSMTTPRTVYDYNLRTGERVVKKVQPVLGGFSSDKYTTRRLWATAKDGVKVPISIAYRPDKASFPAPLHLDAYGSYEMCNDASFASTNLSLMDRGIVVAIAHVRGGGEMGRHWYEDGKFQKKHNTWRDFLSCADHLIEAGITRNGAMTIEGCSAGGLLVGATLNECPEGLFCGAVSLVGFSDVLTTMSDPSIPLTVTEWDEWGNPADEDVYRYMKGYSPYDNVPSGKKFPPILATAGLNDPRVGYWEPLKWVQRVRESDANGGVNVLYRCLMESGHFAKSGRFQRLEEQALVFAFILKCHGLA